jgi:hypothetical protein
MPDEEPNPYRSPEAESRPTRAEVKTQRRRSVRYVWFVILCVGIGVAWGLFASLREPRGYLLRYGIPYGLVVGLAVGILLGAVGYARSYFDSRQKTPRDREWTKE